MGLGFLCCVSPSTSQDGHSVSEQEQLASGANNSPRNRGANDNQTGLNGQVPSQQPQLTSKPSGAVSGRRSRLALSSTDGPTDVLFQQEQGQPVQLRGGALPPLQHWNSSPGSIKKTQVMPFLPNTVQFLQANGSTASSSRSFAPLATQQQDLAASLDYRTSNQGAGHPFGFNDSQAILQKGARQTAGWLALRDAAFPCLSPANLPPAAQQLPIAVLGVELLEEPGLRPSHPGLADDGTASVRSSMLGQLNAGNSRFKTINNLVPVYINASCQSYFGVSKIKDYVAVLRKLLTKDPLLAFAIQKAMRHLKLGECVPVSHVTPDPSGHTSSLFGMRMTPCLWEDNRASVSGLAEPVNPQPAVLIEHNIPYNAAEVMPRLMRDYAVLSHVPAILTLIDFKGKVLYQNASSLGYLGDLLSTQYETGLQEGLLKVLFMYDLKSLEIMLEKVLNGEEWQGIIQVPYNMQRHLANQMAGDSLPHNAAEHHLGFSASQLFGGDLDGEFQVGNSFTTGIRRKQHSSRISQGLTLGSASRTPSMTANRQSRTLHSSVSRGTSHTLQASNSDPFTVQASPHSSAGLDAAPGRRFMSLLNNTGQVSPTPRSPSRRVSAVDMGRPLSRTASHCGDGFSEDMQEGDECDDEDFEDDMELMDEEEEDYDCYHEVHAIPLLDPVLDQQVIMLVQTDVTPRVELENKLADLTDAQLSMLEQLFPRHIIEYMLARVPGKGGKNLRDLANTHDQVMVLYCDVVGFTSMSKEVQPGQVMHFLNELYESFDELADLHNMYKLDIVGDCYIVVAGLIKEDQDGFVCVDEMNSDEVVHNAERILGFAKDMLRASKKVVMPHDGQPVKLRVGIHTGPLVSGLVGAKMPKFTLFGDTMNTGSRMESTCIPGSIHVSDAFAKLIPAEKWKSTGGVEVKGKGMMQTYLLEPPFDSTDVMPPDARSPVGHDSAAHGAAGFVHGMPGEASRGSAHREGRMSPNFHSGPSQLSARSMHALGGVSFTRMAGHATGTGLESKTSATKSANALFAIINSLRGGDEDEITSIGRGDNVRGGISAMSYSANRHHRSYASSQADDSDVGEDEIHDSEARLSRGARVRSTLKRDTKRTPSFGRSLSSTGRNVVGSSGQQPDSQNSSHDHVEHSPDKGGARSHRKSQAQSRQHHPARHGRGSNSTTHASPPGNSMTPPDGKHQGLSIAVDQAAQYVPGILRQPWGAPGDDVGHDDVSPGSHVNSSGQVRTNVHFGNHSAQ